MGGNCPERAVFDYIEEGPRPIRTRGHIISAERPSVFPYPDKLSGPPDREETDTSPELEGELMLLRDIAKLTGYQPNTLAKLVGSGRIPGTRAEKSTAGRLPWMTTVEAVERYRSDALNPSQRGKLGGRPRKSRS